VERRSFTVNFPSEEFAEEADFAGIASGRSIDKFPATGLTPERSGLVDAPFIREFPIVLECRLLHATELGSHTQFIGEILDVKADESVLGANGLPDIMKIKPITYETGQRSYYGVGNCLGMAYTIGKKYEKQG
jgi:flavin reductase (DIM6/NTAB) family NADH-FMN oxidoreductase RutF